MRLLIPIIIVAMIFASGYIMGKHAGRGSALGAKLSRPERKELATLRSFKSSVRSTASDHYELEPTFARLVLDEVERTERKLDVSE